MMKFRNPTFNSFGTIDCQVEHPVHGWIDFHATPYDEEQHGRDIYEVAKDIAAPYVAPPPDLEALASAARVERNALLSASDWTQMPDAPVDTAAWAAYRQALRDVPDQAGFPASIDWPVAP